jgi:hypothetical protein
VDPKEKLVAVLMVQNGTDAAGVANSRRNRHEMRDRGLARTLKVTHESHIPAGSRTKSLRASTAGSSIPTTKRVFRPPPYGDAVIVLFTPLRIKRRVGGAEIDKIISGLQAEKALAAEHRRRADWRKREMSANCFVAEYGHLMTQRRHILHKIR